MDAQQELQHGQTFQQAGRRPEARRCYERALQLEPANGHAWFLLGTLSLAEGQPAPAAASLRQALAFRPRFPEAHFHLGLACQLQGQLADAVSHYRAALALRPAYLEACSNLAAALQAEGKLDDAIAAYRQALVLQPEFAEVHCNLGNALQARGDLPAAIACYREALRLKPDFAVVHNSLGVALKARGELDAAVAAYRAAIAAKPDYLAAHANLALALRAQEKWADALAVGRQALALDPHHAPTLLNLGGILEAQGKRDDALAVYRAMLERDPAHVGAHNNSGIVLQAQGRFDDAIAAYRRALALQPQNVEALTNLGTAFQAQNDLPAAIASYAQALALQPQLGQTRFNLAVCQLAAGDFSAGWRNYEARWQTEQGKFKRSFAQPLWLGETSLAGKTILVYPEQGLGDTLQFARYVPLLAARGATVVMEVQPPLRALCAFFPGVASVVTRGERLPTFDVQCPLLSLPLAFATDAASIPAPVPFVGVSPEKRARWQTRLAATRSPRVGLVWSGGTHHKTDHLRSIPLERFKTIVAGSTATFFCLQKDVKESDAGALASTPEITSLAAQIGDFTDIAALLAHLDLVISVDTAVAHLAGTLGKPTWLLLPFAPDWRWRLGRTDSPWYPTARLFRQPAPGDWLTPLGQVRAALAQWRPE